eukprot:sb/3471505/
MEFWLCSEKMCLPLFIFKANIGRPPFYKMFLKQLANKKAQKTGHSYEECIRHLRTRLSFSMPDGEFSTYIELNLLGRMHVASFIDFKTYLQASDRDSCRRRLPPDSELKSNERMSGEGEFDHHPIASSTVVKKRKPEGWTQEQDTTFQEKFILIVGALRSFAAKSRAPPLLRIVIAPSFQLQ